MSKADQVEIECEADIAVITARVPVSGVRGMAYCLGNYPSRTVCYDICLHVPGMTISILHRLYKLIHEKFARAVHVLLLGIYVQYVLSYYILMESDQQWVSDVKPRSIPVKCKLC